MTRHLISLLTIGLVACGGSQSGSSTPSPAASGAGADSADTNDNDNADNNEATDPDAPERKAKNAGEFQINNADASTRPKQGKLKATKTEAAVRFFVVDKDKGPIKGIVIKLTGPTGKTYYTAETDADGFAEVALPIGQAYDVVYLSLGRRNIAAKVKVANEPHLNLKLTMRYKREDYVTGITENKEVQEPRFELDGVEFDTGKATLTGASHARLDTVVEYMTHKKSARIEVSGHTDNVGNKKKNKKLSQKRADAVRDYLVSQGIDAGRIEAVGYGDERPVASNDTPEGRQKNRRIEATEKQ